MAAHIEAPGSTNAWYAYPGADNDVVLSTRIRLARNLANFPFPQKLRGSDGQRIQAIIFDAFNHFDTAEQYQSVAIEKLDPLGEKILEERGVLSAEDVFVAKANHSDDDLSRGIIMRTDGKVSCTVNIIDHVRIAAFTAGLDVDGALALCKEVDNGMQKSVQFAASYDFGYLTSAVADAGSGMKLSIRVHLPSLAALGRIPSVINDMQEKGVLFTTCYGAGNSEGVIGGLQKGVSLGSFYQLSGTNSVAGTEFDQTAVVVAAVKQLEELERIARADCEETLPTVIRNEMYRSYTLARFSKFITLREAIEIIGAVKWGKDMALLTGIDDAQLHALLFRVQQAHLEFVLKSDSFNFEKDVADNTDRKVCRLRALILQEAFADIHVAD